MKHWFNNGEKEILADTCPEGFTSGRLHHHINHSEASKRINKIHKKNRIWFNNGIYEIQIRNGSDIPEGFIRGRLPSSVEDLYGCHLEGERLKEHMRTIGRKRWQKH